MSSWAKLPRGVAVVTDVPELAAEAEQLGRLVVRIPDDATTATLGSRWSQLTERAAMASLLTGETASDELRSAVAACCDRAQMNRNTGASRSAAWAENMIRNAPLLAYSPPAQTMLETFRGVPAFIVGAGPSLDRNVEHMERARQRGIVLAVNGASKALRKAKHVTPQCVLSVEAHDLSHKMRFGASCKVLSLCCPPSMWGYGIGPSLPIYTGEVSRPFELLTGVPRLATSGSGSTAAVSLAHLWGCDPIVLVGQDLAFSGGRVYAASTGLDDAINRDGTFNWGKRSAAAPRTVPLPDRVARPSMVEGWGGGKPVPSDIGFDAVSGWLTSASGHLPTAINATEGGRHIDGWTDRTLDEVLQGLPVRSLSPMDIRDAAGQVINGPERVTAWLRDKATSQFLDAYAMGDVQRLIDPWRSGLPSRLRWSEHIRARVLLEELDALVANKRRELQQICMEVSR